jgi:5-methylthioadenosine/S-adenosylhomocysteine deaminase
MSRTALRVRELHASIGGLAILKGVDLEVPFGEVHAIMGPNGSGKSTLCHVLAGKPGYEVSGAIAVDGASLVDLDVHERAQAGLFQALQYPVGIPGLDLGVLVEEAAVALGAGPEEARERIATQARQLGMDRFLNRSVNGDLSGGEKKRSEVFQLAVLEPRVMVLDEIDSGLDIDSVREVAAAVEEVGIRGAIARGIFGEMNPGAELMGVPTDFFRWTDAEELSITEECMAERPAGSLVEVWPCPENIVYVTPDIIEGSAHLAEAGGVRWHMHCSEAHDEIGFFEAVHADRPVAWLEKRGVLTHRTTLAHAIWLDPDEVSAMGAAGATAVHNPISNQYLASGVLHLEPLLSAGANVALGSDGVAVAGQDMFEAMKAGALMHRVAHLDSTTTTVEQFLELAALGGATMTGVSGGVIEAGRAADLVILDVDKVRHTPWNRPVASMVHSGRSGDVEMVVVAGEIIVEDGRSTKVDEAEVRSAATEATRRLFGDAQLTGLTKDWQ